MLHGRPDEQAAEVIQACNAAACAGQPSPPGGHALQQRGRHGKAVQPLPVSAALSTCRNPCIAREIACEPTSWEN